MKVVTTKIFIAADGTQFLVAEDAEAYEAKLLREEPERIVAGKATDDFQNAEEGYDRVLADACEALGRKMAEARLARGERKRAPRQTSPGDPVAVPPDMDPAGFREGPTDAVSVSAEAAE